MLDFLGFMLILLVGFLSIIISYCSVCLVRKSGNKGCSFVCMYVYNFRDGEIREKQHSFPFVFSLAHHECKEILGVWLDFPNVLIFGRSFSNYKEHNFG